MHFSVVTKKKKFKTQKIQFTIYNNFNIEKSKEHKYINKYKQINYVFAIIVAVLIKMQIKYKKYLKIC